MKLAMLPPVLSTLIQSSQMSRFTKRILGTGVTLTRAFCSINLDAHWNTQWDCAILGFHVNRPSDRLVYRPYTTNRNHESPPPIHQNAYNPLSGQDDPYASLRDYEKPISRPSTIYYPRNYERWLKDPLPPGFGLSILPNGEKVHLSPGI